MRSQPIDPPQLCYQYEFTDEPGCRELSDNLQSDKIELHTNERTTGLSLRFRKALSERLYEQMHILLAGRNYRKRMARSRKLRYPFR